MKNEYMAFRGARSAALPQPLHWKPHGDFLRTARNDSQIRTCTCRAAHWAPRSSCRTTGASRQLSMNATALAHHPGQEAEPQTNSYRKGAAAGLRERRSCGRGCQPDKNNFAPRIGLVYKLTQDRARGGYGSLQPFDRVGSDDRSAEPPPDQHRAGQQPTAAASSSCHQRLSPPALPAPQPEPAAVRCARGASSGLARTRRRAGQQRASASSARYPPCPLARRRLTRGTTGNLTNLTSPRTATARCPPDLFFIECAAARRSAYKASTWPRELFSRSQLGGLHPRLEGQHVEHLSAQGSPSFAQDSGPRRLGAQRLRRAPPPAFNFVAELPSQGQEVGSRAWATPSSATVRWPLNGPTVGPPSRSPVRTPWHEQTACEHPCDQTRGDIERCSVRLQAFPRALRQRATQRAARAQWKSLDLTRPARQRGRARRRAARDIFTVFDTSTTACPREPHGYGTRHFTRWASPRAPAASLRVLF